MTSEQTRRRFLRRILLAASLLPLLASPLRAADANPSAKWEKDIQAFEAQDKTNPPPKDAVLFIGSSSIRMWKNLAKDFPEVNVINRGFGGSQIIDSAAFADRIVIPYKPKMIVLLAGGNDLNAGKSPEQVCADFKAFVSKIRAALPGERIAFMAINPSPKRAAQIDKQRQANQLIRDYIATEHGIDFVDIFTPLLDSDGKPREDLVIADKLHPNAEGYKIRAELLRPHLAWIAAEAKNRK